MNFSDFGQIEASMGPDGRRRRADQPASTNMNRLPTTRFSHTFTTVLLLLLLSGLAGCFGGEPAAVTPVPTPTTAIRVPTPNLPVPSPTPAVPATLPPPVSVILSPTAPLVIPAGPATATPTTPPAASAQPTPGQTVQIYLIALEDNGRSGPAVGCGDSAVPVRVGIPSTRGVLRAALNALLASKDQFYGESGLYNVFYQSNLTLDNVTIIDGTAAITLSGTLAIGGACDNPRVAAQLEQTALQFSTVSDVEITLNGEALEDVLSLIGE